MHYKSSVNKSFHTLLILSTLLLLLCGLTGCHPSAPVDDSKTSSEQISFDQFLNDLFCSSFENELINLHYTLKKPESYGIEKPKKAASDISADYTVLMKKELEETKQSLSKFNYRLLTEEQKRIYTTLSKYLEQQISLCNYPQFINLLSYTSGLSSNLPLTLAEYAFYSEEDITDYLSILTQIPDMLNQAYTWEENQMKSGYGMSGFEIEDTIEQIDTFLDASKTNLLIDTFEKRLNSVEGLSTDQKTSYIRNNNNLIHASIIPAFNQLKSDLMNLKKQAPEGKGLYYYENGKDYYASLLASMTLSDRPLSTIINTLENRMELLSDRISDVFMKDPDIYTIFASAVDIDFYKNETPEEMLLYLEKAIEKDYPSLTGVSYTVEPIPDALKNDTTAAYYLIPPFDSPEENRIYYGDSMTDGASLFMTLAHEGYPGHLYHQNYLLQNGLSPVFYVLDMTGYKEGWAFYVEIDTADYYDYGEYEDKHHDSLTELYRCNMEYSYCISSLIDLYVNGKGYTRDNIRDYVASLGMDEETADSLYEFAIAEPGTYLQYYIGYLEILSIRRNAEQKTGDNFDKKDFHRTFLDLGPCYYDDLEKYMKQKY